MCHKHTRWWSNIKVQLVEYCLFAIFLATTECIWFSSESVCLCSFFSLIHTGKNYSLKLASLERWSEIRVEFLPLILAFSRVIFPSLMPRSHAFWTILRQLKQFIYHHWRRFVILKILVNSWVTGECENMSLSVSRTTQCDLFEQ